MDDMIRYALLFVVAVSATWSFCTSVARAADVPCHDVFEITFTSKEEFDNPFWDPQVGAVFKSPDGRRFEVEGFYFGGNQWRIRFVPDEVGRWTYAALMKGRKLGEEQRGDFKCVKSDRHGFLRISRKNPYLSLIHI